MICVSVAVLLAHGLTQFRIGGKAACCVRFIAHMF
jgi:hypothetical protein